MLPCALYGVVLLMAAIAYWILQQAIIAAQGPGSILKRAVGRDWKGKVSPALYIAGVAASFWSPRLAQGIYLLVAVLWLVPDRRIENALAVAADNRPRADFPVQWPIGARADHAMLARLLKPEGREYGAGELSLGRSVAAGGAADQDEKMVRDAAREYAQRQARAARPRGIPARAHRSRHLQRDGRAGLARRDHSGGIRRRRPQLRELRPDRARDRARRFGLPFDDERAVLAGDAADLRVRHARNRSASTCRRWRAANRSAASA